MSKPWSDWTLKEKLTGLAGHLPWPLPIELSDSEEIAREALDRIEALEADLKECTAQLGQNTAAARIETLEEALLQIMLTEPVAALDEPDTDAEVIQHFRRIARAALAPEQDRIAVEP